MKSTIPSMILLAVSMPTFWAADAPQPKAGAGDVNVQVHVLDGAGEALPDVEQLLVKSLEAAGADLPETARQALKQAFQQQEQASGIQLAGEAADISAKLDRILDRLDKIEQQISRLNAARKPRVE